MEMKMQTEDQLLIQSENKTLFDSILLFRQLGRQQNKTLPGLALPEDPYSAF